MLFVIGGTVLVMSVFLFAVMLKVTANQERTQNRIETDFSTETFTVKDLWEYTKKENGMITEHYFLVEPENEAFKFRLSFHPGSERAIDALDPGDAIQVKALKSELQEAREGGFINWFKHGGKLNVLAYRITSDGHVLLDLDIHELNDNETGFIGRWFAQGALLVFAICIIGGIIRALWARHKKIATGSAN